MITPELLSYIKNTLNNGHDRHQITKTLLDSGWDEGIINQAFFAIDNAIEVPLPPIEDQKSTSLIYQESNISENTTKNYDPKYYSNLSAFSLLKITLNFFKNSPVLLLLIIVINTISQIIVTYLIPVVTKLPINILVTISLTIILWLLNLLIFQLLSIFLIKKFKNIQSSFSEILVYFKRNLISLLLMNLSIFITITSGYLLFIIPGIIFSFWAYFSLFVYIEEELSILETIDKSRFYSSGNTVGKIISKGLFLGLFITIIFLPLNFLVSKNVFIEGIIKFILYAITTSVSSVYLYNFYLNIKCQKENIVYVPKKSTHFIFKFLPIIAAVLMLLILVFFNKDISNYYNRPKSAPPLELKSNQPSNNIDSSRIEELNKAKDASVQNDATEVLNAYERYFTFLNQFPWNEYNNNPTLTIDSPVLLDSTQAGFGICYSDSDVNPASAVGVCNTDKSAVGKLIESDEIGPSFVTRNSFKNPGTNGENKLWTIKTFGSTGISEGSLYVCYIPKATTNRLMVNKLKCLNNSANPVTITSVGSYGCSALSSNDKAWSIPTLDGVTGMFVCVPN